MNDDAVQRPVEQPAPELESQLRSLFNRLEVLDLKLERQNLQLQQPKDEKKQPWWKHDLIGLPALLIAMFLQFGQATEVPGNKAKTEAETKKLNTEELKVRAELQEIIQRLEAKQTESASASARELRKVLPDLREAVARLQDAQKTSSGNTSTSTSLVAKYLVIWGLPARPPRFRHLRPVEPDALLGRRPDPAGGEVARVHRAHRLPGARGLGHDASSPAPRAPTRCRPEQARHDRHPLPRQRSSRGRHRGPDREMPPASAAS